MTDTLIQFDTAKLAKEKGIEIPHTHFYVLDYSSFKSDGIPHKNSVPDDCGDNILQIWKNRKWQPHIAPAYTQSVLQKWLREVHKIEVWIKPVSTDKYSVYVDTDNGKHLLTDYVFKKTYESALESGLVEGLKLIEI